MRKRIMSIILAGLVAVTMLVGCNSSATSVSDKKQAYNNSEKTKITLMLDQDGQVDIVGNYLKEKYPDVEFDILVGHTGVAYLKKAAENGDLPDIIVSGDTWGREGTILYPYLYDFSATDIASEFYTIYLDNYTTADGSVYWLPGCAATEGILANKKLFEENSIELPTDYPSFVNACNRLTELGIRPYISDYKYNYTDAYLLQGCSIPLLQSREGKMWRLSYEAGETDVLDESIGLQMFENLNAFFALTGVTPDDAKQGFGATLNAFVSGKVAMIRQSTVLSDYYGAGFKPEDLVLLPYFGETENDNWYFTLPAYGVAMSGELKDTDKEELGLDIVRSLFSQEGMDIFAGNVNSFVAYNKNISFEVNEQFENVKQYLNSNHLYSYLSQDDFQAASYRAVQKMIAESATPEEALNIFNETITQTHEDKPVVTTFEKGYSREWTAGGNRAMSATLNTLCRIAESDILLSPSTISPGSIYEGGYTEEELLNLLLGGGISFYRKELTGAEIKNVVATAVKGAGTKYDPISLSTLPGVSGCKMIVSKAEDGSYQLDDLLVNGEAIQEDASYQFVYAYTNTEILRAAFGWNKEDYDGRDIAVGEKAEGVDFSTYKGFVYPAQHAADLWKAYFEEGGTIAEPTEYIQVR